MCSLGDYLDKALGSTTHDAHPLVGKCTELLAVQPALKLRFDILGN